MVAKYITMLLVVNTLLGCSLREQPSKAASKNILPTPTLVWKDSIAIPDPLNKQYFVVSIIPTAAADTYEIKAAYGHNEGTGTLIMPRNSKGLKPSLRKADTPMTFRIGFYRPNDATLYDYFEVNARSKNIEMKYIKAYSFK